MSFCLKNGSDLVTLPDVTMETILRNLLPRNAERETKVFDQFLDFVSLVCRRNNCYVLVVVFEVLSFLNCFCIRRKHSQL